MSWRGWSVFGLLLLLVAALMLLPAAAAALDGDAAVLRAFAAGAALTGCVAGLILIATHRLSARTETVGEFGALFAALIVAPAAAALPLKLAAPQFAAEALYFEMVSTFTTTGATIFDRPEEIPRAIHFWRGLTAWLGGLLALVMAFALLAPRNLGGYEVQGERERRGAIGRLKGEPEWAGGRGREAAADRVATAIGAVLPIYFGLTAALAVLLVSAGQGPRAALVSAMGVVSTSGVSAEPGAGFGGAGLQAEIAAAAFLILASTRLAFGEKGTGPLRLREMPSDPEMRVLAIAVAGATLWLFVRHWIGALDLVASDDESSLKALWGAFFTALSFATTTGVVSESWDAARAWSGLDNPSLILFGLAMMGG
ncbi:MAG: potassium transporter TrkG, partial [Pseudomonadota bacterium]